MTKKDREIVAGELVKVARDLTSARGPFRDAIDKYWNELHDLERRLEQAAYEYDVAASYRGKDGMRDSESMRKNVNEVKKMVEQLLKYFDLATNREMKYLKKHGTPQEYTERMRNEMFPN